MIGMARESSKKSTNKEYVKFITPHREQFAFIITRHDYCIFFNQLVVTSYRNARPVRGCCVIQIISHSSGSHLSGNFNLQVLEYFQDSYKAWIYLGLPKTKVFAILSVHYMQQSWRVMMNANYSRCGVINLTYSLFVDFLLLSRAIPII